MRKNCGRGNENCASLQLIKRCRDSGCALFVHVGQRFVPQKKFQRPENHGSCQCHAPRFAAGQMSWATPAQVSHSQPLEPMQCQPLVLGALCLALAQAVGNIEQHRAASTRNKVVFPEPLGPRIATRSPDAIVNSETEQIVRPFLFTRSPWISIIRVIAIGAVLRGSGRLLPK